MATIELLLIGLLLGFYGETWRQYLFCSNLRKLQAGNTPKQMAAMITLVLLQQWYLVVTYRRHHMQTLKDGLYTLPAVPLLLPS